MRGLAWSCGVRGGIGRAAVAVLAGFVLLLTASGCASTAPGPDDDPWEWLVDGGRSAEQRTAAVDVAWAQVIEGRVGGDAGREAMRELFWKRTLPSMVRLGVLDRLVEDPDEEGLKATREMLRLALPTERDRDIVRRASEEAAARGWTDQTPALVRALSTPQAGVPLRERPEARAIEALHTDRSLDEVVFSVFLDPATRAGPGDARLDRRVREDAWALLSRLDTSGTARLELLESGADRGDSEGVVGDLRASWRDLGTLPETGPELRWLRSLRSGSGREAQRNRAWWTQATEAIAKLDDRQRDQLELRHAEPIRWASRHESSWLDASREELFDVLAERLDGRRKHRRTVDRADDGGPHRDRLDDFRDRLRWADVLTILVVDEAVQQQSVVESLVDHARMDRRDRTTEYGGVLEWAGEGGFRVVLYPPRPADRVNDYTFIASPDMIRASDRALAHYHLHAASEMMSAHAGPSRTDLRYAATSGRTCVVFTSLRPGVLNVDYYQPDGVVIDLGEIQSR